MSKILSPIVDAFMYTLILLAQRVMADEARPAKSLPRRALPDLEQREAASWFDGWWHGIAVGSVIGVGLTVVLFTSGVMA